jgi:hypothetical protein
VDYIKEVKVYEGQFMREQDWISTDHAGPLLLHMLVKLQKIEFHRLEWTEISEDLKQSICLMLELPTLSQIAASTAWVNLGVCSHAKGFTHPSSTGFIHWSMCGETELKG